MNQKGIEENYSSKEDYNSSDEIEILQLRKRGRQSIKLQKLLQLQKYTLSKTESMDELLALRERGKVLFVAYLRGGEADFIAELQEKIGLPIDTTYQSTGAISNSLENHLKTAVRVTTTYLRHPKTGEPLRVKFRGTIIELKATAVDY